jgi:hypothetical protein
MYFRQPLKNCKIEVSLCIFQEVISKSRLPQINISNDYKKQLKNPETSWPRYMGVPPIHSEKQHPSPMCMFHLGALRVSSKAHDI